MKKPKKLNAEEIVTLLDLLNRATGNEQVSVKCEVNGKPHDQSFGTTTLAVSDDDCLQVGIILRYSELAWIWRRVCGARDNQGRGGSWERGQQDLG